MIGKRKIYDPSPKLKSNKIHLNKTKLSMYETYNNDNDKSCCISLLLLMGCLHMLCKGRESGEGVVTHWACAVAIRMTIIYMLSQRLLRIVLTLANTTKSRANSSIWIQLWLWLDQFLWRYLQLE